MNGYDDFPDPIDDLLERVAVLEGQVVSLAQDLKVLTDRLNRNRIPVDSPRTER
jgi:hypothetical protein